MSAIPGILRYRPHLTETDFQAVRQMVIHLNYTAEQALDAIGRRDLLPVPHHLRAAGTPAKMRTVAGGTASTGARALSSSLGARPHQIPTSAGFSEDLTAQTGAADHVLPPFWLAELRGIARPA